MITFEGHTVPANFKSDGCTFAPDKIYDFDLFKFEVLCYDLHEKCVFHDYLRRDLTPRGVMTVEQADAMFKRFIRRDFPSWLATIYWVGVKLMRVVYA